MLSCENLDVRFFLIACICLRIIYISVFFSETCSTLNLGQSVRVYYLTTLCCIKHKNPRSIFFVFYFSVDGGFTLWSDWSPCTVTCGGGTTTRDRTCTNPTPQYGGNQCDGDTSETTSCYTDSCPGSYLGLH